MNKRYLFPLFSLLFMMACEHEPLNNEEQESSAQTLNETEYVKGYMRLRVSEELAGQLELSVAEGKPATRAVGADDLMGDLGVKVLKRTFPHAGRFEPRTRAAGLHLWYDVEFDETLPLTRAGRDFSDIPGIDEIEYRPKVERMWSDEVIPADLSAISQPAAAMPFNDPALPDQWHYHNDGSVKNYKDGADVDVFRVWKDYTSGSKDIIVAIVDGGVDYTHEDLAANMWINSVEKNGNKGQDDDNNGYKDDINGYNFVAGSGNIVPHNHGTHVAGTIGAVNNNGKGVCGLAGGDGSGNGVRLMSCQIFVDESDPYADNSGQKGAEAIKYAADNGATICQNSWGYPELTSTPSSDRAAIDYFITYAGIDENGNQIGQMKGGLVIFSAGNENREGSAPGSYENVVGVTSIGPDYKRAYYSNFGSWADITAPGGDQKAHGAAGGVLSTLVGNKYGYMQGTSMSCPHVSGVAALVAAQYGGNGFTPAMLRLRLERGVVNIDQYNPNYKGKLGKGLLSAFGAIAGGSTTAPDKVTAISGSVRSNVVKLKWNVTADLDDGKAAGFNVYYRKSSVKGININNLPGDVLIRSVITGDLNVGDPIEIEIDDLDFESQYYFAVSAFDFSSNFSALSNEFTVATLKNTAPVIEALNGTEITLAAHETVVLHFNISDPDGHAISWNFEAGSVAATAVALGDKIQVTIVGKQDPEVVGTYEGTLTVEDKYGAKVAQKLTYTILQNTPPHLLKEVENVLMNTLNTQATVNLDDYFADADGEKLKYEVTSRDTTLAHINANNGILYIVSARYGLTDVTVTATDAMGKIQGESVEASFKLLIRNEEQVVDLYPNPVVNNLNVRMGENKECQITIYNTSGAKVLEQHIQTSPFAPASLDLSKLPGGQYSVRLAFDGREITRNIVKL